MILFRETPIPAARVASTRHRPSSTTLLSSLLVFGALVTPLHFLFAVGATVPFVSYEGEAGVLAGGAAVRALARPATDPWSSPELEASGRAFVELNATGESVTWTNNTGKPVDVMNIRYSIPDAPTGGGIEATLNLYVDGVFRQAIPLSSKQIWLYDEAPGQITDSWNGMGQDPSRGNPHVFYEEAHFWITGAPIPPGSTIMFKKDEDNTASFYWIDIVDLEQAATAITRPANSLSITDPPYNAQPTPTFSGPLPANPVDNGNAIQNCINAARTQGRSVWIPPGRFVFKRSLNCNNVVIQGAGMWHSKLYRNITLPSTTPQGSAMEVNGGQLKNFFLDTNAPSRTQLDGCWGGVNISGNNWVVDGLWVQHASSGVWCKGNNGIVKNGRMLSNWGDGVNINNGNTGNVGNFLVCDNNYVRGCGDDGVTINSDITSTQMESPVLSNNTSVAIWWADGLRVAGGRNIVVRNNLIYDPAKFPGIIVGTFNGQPIEGGIVEDNVIIRGGGNAYNQHKSALDIGPGTPYVADVIIRNNTMIDSIENGMKIDDSPNFYYENNVVDGVWEGSAPTKIGRGLQIVSGAAGSGVFVNNTVKNIAAGQTAYVNSAPAANYAIGGFGNTGFTVASAPPSPWTSQTVGTVGIQGGSSLSNGVFAVSGSGSDIGGTSDNFHYVSRPSTGDFKLIARVQNLENINTASKSGVMVRESSAPDSANCAVLVTPGTGLTFLRRTATGATAQATTVANIKAPCWVRLERVGQTFSASYSADGANWTQVGSPVDISMPNSVLAGLAVTSRLDGTLASSMLDNVAVNSLPSPWKTQDIGAVNIAGNNSYAGTAFTLAGSGADIWGNADAFFYAYQTLSGDGTIQARVVSQENTNSAAKAGIMIRESLNANSRNAAVLVKPGNIVTFQRRTGSSSTTETASNGVNAPYWVRLTRSGNSFTASRSTNGTAWTNIGSATTVSMGANVLIGLAVTSHDNTKTSTAVFDDVSIIIPPSAPSALTATAVSESQVLLAWTNNANNATSITVQRSIAGQNSWTTLTSSLAPTTTSYVAGSLNPSTAYDFRVRCDGPTGSSSYITATATTPAGIGDGIPGWWRYQYFGNGLTLTPESSPSADPDGDGKANTSEFNAGTNPVDWTSVFRVSDVQLSDGTVVVKFDSISGKTYVLERSASPAGSGPWSVVQDNIAGTGSPITISSPLPDNSPKQFYRARIK